MNCTDFKEYTLNTLFTVQNDFVWWTYLSSTWYYLGLGEGQWDNTFKVKLR